MKVFISYRRDDTAGRAGRLFDALIAKFGARNVFQDVAAIAPGTDFDREVRGAISRSDVALVVIGAGWLHAAAPDGSRRLDDPDDYVRREVGAALAADVPVVPVLVGGAALPAAGELPEELRSLPQRQAVTIRDASWHPDVEDLARRLRHEDVVEERRLRWPLIAGAAVVVVAIASVVAWRLTAGDGSGGDGESGDVLTGCPALDSSWSALQLAEQPTAARDRDGQRLVYTVRSASVRPQDETFTIMLEVDLANEGPELADTLPYYNEAEFAGLLVDGRSVGDAICLTVVGDPNIEVGERATGFVGFESTEDPADVPLVLELLGGDPDIAVTG